MIPSIPRTCAAVDRPANDAWHPVLHKTLAQTPWSILLIVCALFAARPAPAGDPTCMGKFINPITDICWSCVLPLTIGNARVGDWGGQEDIENPSNPVCSCGTNPTIGVQIGYWEPARRVEVVRRPFCLVSMGGVALDPGIHAPSHGRDEKGKRGAQNAFYQVHYYTDPVLYWLEVLGQFPCLEKGAFDIAYITEADPLWGDDELNLLLNPEALLFANPIAIAACAADCVAASTGFGVKDMFWCSGCQGVVYPLNGWTGTHKGGIDTSSLMTHRILSKLHRQLVAWGWHGSRGLCGPYFEPAMDKRAYKTQLVHPVAQTAKIAGKCCQPIGRTSILWGAGRERPVLGEDFAYQVFRKRNCCMGY